eukprot:1029516-Ditylum_brightwellii.AAC.1
MVSNSERVKYENATVASGVTIMMDPKYDLPEKRKRSCVRFYQHPPSPTKRAPDWFGTLSPKKAFTAWKGH